MLTQARLKDILSYDKDTGLFTWIKTVRRTDLLGQIAGFDANGYIGIRIGRKPYMAHRLAWLYVTGEWPSDEIDHRNRVRSDNRFDNLRSATHHRNTFNQSVRKNSSGVTGVTWDQVNKKWRAHISPNGRMISLGRHSSLDGAVAARKRAEVQHFGEFAPGAV